MSAPDLLYGEVEEDLRTNVRRLLSARCEWTEVLARCESDEPYDLRLWRTLADELGLASLLIPERCGGSGGSARELGVLAEELGRAVAPVPFVGSVMATSLLGDCTTNSRAAEIIPELSAGRRNATVAVGLTDSPYGEFPDRVEAHDGRLHGHVPAVVDLEVANYVLVPAKQDGLPGLYLVQNPSSGVDREPATPLDLTRRFGTLSLDSARAEPLLVGDSAVESLRRALVVAAGTLASEQVGLAQQCLDTTVEYALTRYQFGRQIGSFQAVKHRLADLWTAVSNGRAVARHAADCLARDEERELSVALAQSHCCDLAVHAAEEHLQLHGGIGMTWEHPAHLYLGRAKSGQLTFGTAQRHRARLGELVDLPAS